MTSIAPAPKKESLFHIEEQLEALLNSVDLVETEEDRASISAELGQVLERAASKRDQVAGWLAQQESTIDAIGAEIDRLCKLRDARCRAVSNVETYVMNIILAKGPDAKGKFPRLEGVTSRLSVRKNPPAIEITDESMVPEQYQSVTCFFTPSEWREFSSNLDMETYSKLTEYIKSRCANRTEIKKALDQGETVPGASLAPTKYRLLRE